MPILESAGAALPGRPAVASLAPLGGVWAGTRGCLPNAPDGPQAGAVAVAILRWSQRLPAPRRAPAASNAARPRPDNSGGQRAGSHLAGSTSAHTAGRRAYLKIDPRGATTASPPFAEQVSVSGGQAVRGTARPHRANHCRPNARSFGVFSSRQNFARRRRVVGAWQEGSVQLRVGARISQARPRQGGGTGTGPEAAGLRREQHLERLELQRANLDPDCRAFYLHTEAAAAHNLSFRIFAYFGRRPN